MITSIVSKLPFIERQKTLDFYTGQLGFSLSSDYGDYIILNHGTAELHLFLFRELLPAKSDFMIYLRMDDMEAYYQKIQSLGVAIHPNGKLEQKPWGQKEFSIVDPNGTLLTFGQSIA